jgi:sugar lactone lactonase YvrE
MRGLSTDSAPPALPSQPNVGEDRASTPLNLLNIVAPTLLASTYAGDGLAGSDDGPADTASFQGLMGVTVDSNGNVFVSDSFDNKIRKITPAGAVSTLYNGASSTLMRAPLGITTDRSNNLYIADAGSNRVHKITPGGALSLALGINGYQSKPET